MTPRLPPLRVDSRWLSTKRYCLVPIAGVAHGSIYHRAAEKAVQTALKPEKISLKANKSYSNTKAASGETAPPVEHDVGGTPSQTVG